FAFALFLSIGDVDHLISAGKQYSVPYCHTPESVPTSTPEPHNTSQETAEEEEAGSDSSSFQVEETRELTNGEMSEEEPEMVVHSQRLLDQASVVSERYIHSISRQSSLISEDLGSVACSSPLTDNEPLTYSSGSVDLEKDIQMFSNSPEPLSSSHEPELNDFTPEERRSTLSKQDILLIHKIRRYYEHAEHQDINFSIKRRESLSYIPAGLVRQLSKQINSTPLEQATPLHKKELSRNRPTSWSVFDLPGLDRIENTERHLETEPMSTSYNNEVFKPSSEMLKLWEEMDLKEESDESQHTTGQPDHQLLQAPHTYCLESSEQNNTECQTTEDQVNSSSLAVSVEETESDCKPDKGHFSPEYLPKTISFQTSMEEDEILQDMGKMKSKVFQLARQYSQRIKNNRPTKWQKSQEAGTQPGLRSMLAVQEERTTFRKNVQTPSSGVSSHSTLISPHTPQSEVFHWPDVQELRTKYTQDAEANSSKMSQNSTVVHTPVGTPLSSGTDNSQKYSSSSDLHKAFADRSRSKSVPVHHEGRCGLEDWAPPKGRSVLCRWSSLEHMLSSHPLHEVQNLQHPVRSLHTTSQLCLASRDMDSSDSHLYDSLESDTKAAIGSGKFHESNIVRSLREKFQSLSSSS
uniref:Uncharacterized protein n=1 Tax=Neogobius melanostomus TaxID=47308 RepID=A0A8C6UMV2_9GOBI